MSSASPRRRLTLALTVGALVGLTTLAMPTAATAAEVCVASTTPTTETQPWQTFAESPNQFAPIEDAYEVLVEVVATQFATVDADFTQAEYDALYATILEAYQASDDTLTPALETLEAQKKTLLDGLLAVDPTHEAENQAIVDGFNTVLVESQYGQPFGATYGNYLTELNGYAEAVQAAITAGTPRPTVPASFTAASDAFAAGVEGLGAFAQANVYDAAGAYVVFPQVCTTVAAAPTLAATGSNDVAPISIGAALLLLAGAVSLISARQRKARA